MRYALAFFWLAACLAPASAPAPAEPAVSENVRRLTAILDYIAADYPGAVADGKVAVPFEYEEQLAFLADAAAIAGALPAPAGRGVDPAGELAIVRALVERIAPGDDVAAAARAARKRLLGAYGIVLAPAGPPSLERGRALYAENCTACHGARGAGDGERAHELDPKPRSFLAADVMTDLTPARAFNALTDGLEGTAMASYGLLPASDRWSLAFFVFTLRHDDAAVERGADAYARAGRVIAATATRLSGASDGELLGALASAGLDAPACADALAFLRGAAPYRTSGSPFETTRRRLSAAAAAYEAGNAGLARRELSAAYLDGFEPHEAALGAQDAALVASIERTFLAAREAIQAGDAPGDVAQHVLRIGALLDAAEEKLAGGGAGVAFASAFAIILREGLEGALLVLLLLGWARQAGAEARDHRAVHIGWLVAVGLGALTWIAAGSVIARLGGARRELIEGVVALLAAVVLLAASHFVLARLDAKRRVAALRERLQAAISTPRRRWVLASLAFVAVYREAFEVVLFLQALMLDAHASAAPVVGGAAAAAALLVVLVVAMRRIGGRLQPGPLLTAAGTLLCALAVVLAGKGVRSLQEAGIVGIAPLQWPRLDWVGLYPTVQTVAAQAVALGAFAAIAVWALRRSQPAA
jgi:high-affinity iron transporter